MLLLERLRAQLGGNPGRIGERFGLADPSFKRFPFLFSVEIREVNRRVVFRKLFEHASVALAHYVASGKMQQSCVMTIAKEVEQVGRRAHIRRQSVAKVRIEIREAGAVYD